MMTEQGKDNQMTAEKNAAFGKLNSDLKAGRVNIRQVPLFLSPITQQKSTSVVRNRYKEYLGPVSLRFVRRQAYRYQLTRNRYRET